MAAFRDESSDDEIGVNLQLAKRLSINKNDCVPTRGYEKKSLKNLYNQSRRRQVHEFCSSSSSSPDMHSEPFSLEASSSYGSHNKKRHNRDKGIEQFGNPKRTCLSNGLQRSSGRRKHLLNPSESSQFGCSIPSSSTSRNLLPDKVYENAFNNDTNEDDSDFEPRRPSRGIKRDCPQPVRKGANSAIIRPKHTNQGSRVRSMQLIDSTSDDDSRSIMQKGTLKGGRQSPETTSCSSRVPLRKVKKVLDSDTDDEWPVKNYRNRPLIFSSSSDSENSVPINSKPTSASGNPLFSSLDSHNSNQDLGYFKSEPMNISFGRDSVPLHPDQSSSISHRTKSNTKRPLKTSQGRVLPVQPTVQIAPINNISISLHSGRDIDGVDGPSTTTDFPQGRALCNHRSLRSPRFRNVTGRGIHQPFDSPSSNVRFGRSERNSIDTPPKNASTGHRQFSDRNRVPQPPTGIDPVLNSSRNPTPHKISFRSLPIRKSGARRGLSRTHPDLFDAEESSEVEFFTANSYSDNESNDSVSDFIRRPGNLDLGDLPLIDHPIQPSSDPINVASSEDEISVVYSNTAPRSCVQQRGSPRTLGRRFHRRSGHQPHSQGASLSPDPVALVRQVEDDERFAKMLQAQFDAEQDPTYSPCLHHNPVNNLSRLTTSSEESSDALDVNLETGIPGHIAIRTSQADGFQPLLHGLNLHLRRHASALNLTFSPRPQTARRGRPQTARPQTARRGRSFAVPEILERLGWGHNLLASSDDSYEAFLGLADLHGDVPRGLQKTEINRLPTRKYLVPGASMVSASADIPHKRADLNKECQVCLNDYENGDVLRILPCFHEFHTPCIDPWLKINHTCPVCRVRVDLEQ